MDTSREQAAYFIRRAVELAHVPGSSDERGRLLGQLAGELAAATTVGIVLAPSEYIPKLTPRRRARKPRRQPRARAFTKAIVGAVNDFRGDLMERLRSRGHPGDLWKVDLHASWLLL